MKNDGKDPMGAAMSDYLSGKTTAKIKVKTSLGDDSPIPASYLFRHFDEMPEAEQLALSLCRGKVLDVGAGAGCHSLYLQTKGVDVTSIDISQASVDVMQKQGLKKASEQNIYDVTDRYDTLLMLMNGIGIVEDLEGLDKFLSCIPQWLKDGGQVLLDSADIMYMFEQEDGSFKISLSKYYGEMTYELSYGKVKGESFKWLYIDFATLEQYAAAHGLKCEMLHEDDNCHYLARIVM